MSSMRLAHPLGESRMAARCAAAILCTVVAPVGLAQMTARKLEFDVASVKINKAEDKASMNFSLGAGDGYAPNGGNFVALTCR